MGKEYGSVNKHLIMGIGKMVNRMDSECINGKMEVVIQANGKMDWSMAKEKTHFPTKMYLLEYMLMASLKVKED